MKVAFRQRRQFGNFGHFYNRKCIFGKWTIITISDIVILPLRLLSFGIFRHFCIRKDSFGKGIFHSFGILDRQALLHIYHSVDFQMRNILGGKIRQFSKFSVFLIFPFF